MTNTIFNSIGRASAIKRLHSILALAALSLVGVASAQDIRATVDNNLVSFPDVQPIMSDGRVMVPVRGVFEHMNANVVWDADTHTVVAQRGNDTIRLRVNAYSATINDRHVSLDTPAAIYNGRTMVPLRFLSEALGATVEWVAATRTVEIRTVGVFNALPINLGDSVVATDIGSGFNATPAQRATASPSMSGKQYDLYASMRKLWGDHTTWTRLLIVGIANDLSNTDATTARLMQNQTEIGDALNPYYGNSAGDKLTSLLRSHISIAGELVSAAKTNDSRDIASKKQQWYENSDRIADFLSTANPSNWSNREMRDMMHEHLDLTIQEVEAEMNGDFSGSIRKYDQVRTQALKMADMMSAGIIKQFPAKFTGAGYVTQPTSGSYTAMRMDSGTVIPFRLNQSLSSNESKVGDRYTAILDTTDGASYQGLSSGAILEGHVDVARAKTGTTPGVLGLAFDRIRMPGGKTYPVTGSLIGLDSGSVSNENGRLVAKPGAKNDLKYVGYGAGGGALVAILTKGNVITNALIGGALGFLYGEIQKSPSKARNVTLDSGSRFGVRLTNDFAFRVPAIGLN
jgi:hypothetical protein